MFLIGCHSKTEAVNYSKGCSSVIAKQLYELKNTMYNIVCDYIARCIGTKLFVLKLTDQSGPENVYLIWCGSIYVFQLGLYTTRQERTS